MTCQELWELASDYLDRQVEEATAAQIRRHAGQCEACRTELETVAQAMDARRAAAQPAGEPAEMARAARWLRAELARDARRSPEEEKSEAPPSPTVV